MIIEDYLLLPTLFGITNSTDGVVVLLEKGMDVIGFKMAPPPEAIRKEGPMTKPKIEFNMENFSSQQEAEKI